VPGTVATPFLMQDPGYMWWAPVGTTAPTNGGTSSGTKFTDTFSASYVEVGATEEGHTFKYEINVEPVTVAEFLDPVLWRTTERNGSMAFNMADYTLNNWKRALNGGTITTTSNVSKYVPPDPGQEIRAMLVWESLDATMRIYMYQVINAASMQTEFKKAPAIAVLPCEFRFEIPTVGKPFEVYGASTARLGV
jgi:hypothetical protein